MNKHSDIDSLLRSVQIEIETRTNVDQEVMEELSELYERREQLASESFESFLDRHLTEAKRKQQAGEIETLCRCRFATCKLKAGRIPAKIKREIRKADTPLRGEPDVEGAIQSYLINSSHGDPVLRDALDEYRSRKAELRRNATALKIRVRGE